MLKIPYSPKMCLYRKSEEFGMKRRVKKKYVSKFLQLTILFKINLVVSGKLNNSRKRGK